MNKRNLKDVAAMLLKILLLIDLVFAVYIGIEILKLKFWPGEMYRGDTGLGLVVYQIYLLTGVFAFAVLWWIRSKVKNE